MKPQTMANLEVALDLCQHEERSLEYTIQFLQDFARVDFDCVIKFLRIKGEEEELKDLI